MQLTEVIDILQLTAHEGEADKDVTLVTNLQPGEAISKVKCKVKEGKVEIQIS